MAKPWAEGFYHSREWKAMREIILHRDRYSCVRCGAPGTEVHHKVRLTEKNIRDKSIALNPANLELLCDRCHKDEHEAERQKEKPETKAVKSIELDYQFDEAGNLLPRRGS